MHNFKLGFSSLQFVLSFNTNDKNSRRFIEYSKTANDKDLSQLVSAYENTKEMGDTMFSRAVPWFSGMTAASAGAAAVSNSVYKKRKREEKFASEDRLIENSFDK